MILELQNWQVKGKIADTETIMIHFDENGQLLCILFTQCNILYFFMKMFSVGLLQAPSSMCCSSLVSGIGLLVEIRFDLR